MTNENAETFNFGVLNGVRGFFTNPSRADDSFIPFKSGGKLLDYSLWRYAGSFTKTFNSNDKFTECYVLCASVNAGSDPYVNYTSSNITVTVIDTKDFQDSGSGWKFRSKLLKLTDIKEGSSITLSFHWTTVYAFFAV